MAWKSKYIIVTGQEFKNKSFNYTEEYFELMRLLNKYNRDPDFDIFFEIIRGNSSAIRLWELFTIASDIHIGDLARAKRAKASKRGPHRYSEMAKLKALQDWDELDKNISPITLQEFLEKRFADDRGISQVAESTFHGWRQQLRKSGKYKNP